ncbi:MAG: hypothetical protein LC808_22765 [Actinobacteria bacterium]|nr:hypothetical protein [Actinomycetota bacterium]
MRPWRYFMILVPIVAVTIGGVRVLMAQDSSRPLEATASESSHPPQGATVGFQPSRTKGPLGAGHRSSLSEARDRAPFPILRPDHPRASDASLASVFLEALPKDTGGLKVQVALDYGSGIVIILQRALDAGLTGDTTAQYQSYAAGLVGAEVTTVHGVPAVVVQGGVTPGSRADGLNPSVVDLTLNGVRIQIYGQFDASITAQNLVEVAETIK